MPDEAVVTHDVGWIEAAREAARAVREAMSMRDLPYKVTQYNPDTRDHRILTSKWTLGEAYNYPRGTHVVQTHGTDAEVHQMLHGNPVGGEGDASTAKMVGAGYLLGGFPGAAIGGMASGTKYGKWYKLPSPIITPKPPPPEKRSWFELPPENNIEDS
jgi:hypothetical protein